MAAFEAGWGGVTTLRGSIRSRYVALVSKGGCGEKKLRGEEGA
jgi:hypothetical protein